MKIRVQFVLLVAVLVLCGSMSNGEPETAPQSPVKSSPRDETVVVDFTKNEGPVTGCASGFLHSVSADAPGDELIAPLKPRMWRSRALRNRDKETLPAIYPRLKKLGVEHIQVILSEEWGSSSVTSWPGDGGDWTAWDGQVQAVLNVVQSQGMDIQYDIWNEPDNATFWGRERLQFFETWKHTVEFIRKSQPTAIIVGPSIARFSMDWMQDFFLYAKSNKVLPDVLSWHELRCEGVPYSYLEKRISGVRQFLAQNEIPITRFSINEYLGEYNADIPGAIVGHFASLEQAKVESAAHSGWPETGSRAMCDMVSLDGLLDPNTYQRRAAWWVYKAYADFAGDLFALHPSPTVQGIASWDASTMTVRILLGRWRGGDEPVHLMLTNLDKIGLMKKNPAVLVRVERIIPSGWDVSNGPKLEMEKVVPLTVCDLDLLLPALGRNDACLITVTDASATNR